MRTAGPRHHHGACGVSELVLLEGTFWNAWQIKSRLPGSHVLVCHTLKQFRVMATFLFARLLIAVKEPSGSRPKFYHNSNTCWDTLQPQDSRTQLLSLPRGEVCTQPSLWSEI